MAASRKTKAKEIIEKEPVNEAVKEFRENKDLYKDSKTKMTRKGGKREEEVIVNHIQ